MDFRKFLTVPLAVFVLFAVVPGFAADVNELERRLDIVSEELDRMKNSSGGSGIAHRTSVHGYGETHWIDDPDGDYTVDQHRFVIGVHSELTDWIHLNAEIDFEHAAQELEFEFGHLDFLVSNALNFRAGTMLMPMGNLNEFHEPNNFFTVERPDFHVNLIPSTWQQAGFGIHGAQGDYSYRLYLTNAVQSMNDTLDFNDDTFIRKGRSQINKVEVGNIAISARLEKKAPGGQAGFSFYTGGSTGSLITQDGQTTIVVADYKTKRGALDLDFGIFKGWVADTLEINAACGTMASAACGGDVPQSAFGLLMTAGVHVPEMMKMNTIHDIIPFIQYQKIRPQDEVGDGATVVPQSNYDVFTVGVAYKPDPKVALKANYVTKYYGGTEAANARYGDAGSSGSAFNMAVAYQY